ncbi:MAG: acetyl-CoA carboxylase biotin carboxyl carrier protein [Pseudopedobacter saltans]|uniref:Biotin carboxyl carrier protein of acetyl-CoA carboxylase n=1 Tax=Pseudopedobacter saltans TaxID=151895 RepID=A0A2W5EE75_9SPHI|nr:MAG: acetyl-CoA carboxylase biotin carboxyl carrier protein [Pseudopedobacter saltans]
MDFKQIQELIKTINKSNIGELCIQEKDFKICIKQKVDNIIVGAPAPTNYVAAPAPTPLPAAQAPATTSSSTSPTEDTNKYVTIKSPMIGTFYRKPSPDKPNLVDEGTDINPGKVVCIIEAMKLFNEIESEVSGKIVKILVDDASPVEFDQPLFLVEP